MANIGRPPCDEGVVRASRASAPCTPASAPWVLAATIIGAASAQGCGECLEIGDTWVHLRECLVCGHVGCCDSSKNKHATKHFLDTSHPIVASLEPGEDWRWCYVDETLV